MQEVLLYEDIFLDRQQPFQLQKDYGKYQSPEDKFPSGEQRCLVGGSGVATSKHLILTGGVNYRIFKDALEGRAPEDYMKKSPEWYRFNRDILVYSSEQGTWQVLDGTEAAARAGGVLLQKDGLLYMVCGEIKPGVRSAEVNVISVFNEKNI